MIRTAATAAALVLVALRIAGQGGPSPIVVAADGDLQAALNRARPGDTIVLEQGATYVGNFVLPAKTGSSQDFITVRSSARDSVLPDTNTRMTPAAASLLPKLRSPNSQPVLSVAPGAHHYRLLFLEFQSNAGGAGDIIALGDGSGAQTTAAQVPHDLIVDRSYVHGDAELGQKRGIALNSASTSIINSYIADIKASGQDSQAIAGWNGPGPFTIANNYLEAAGENVLFGGADPSIPNLVPSDITITDNQISRPTVWRNQRWTVKNLLELKNARRVRIAGNVIEYNWQNAQSGFGILFTPRNQDGRCPWCQVEQVMFERNIVRHSAAGISITGRDDNHPSQQTRGITIRNNIFNDIDSKTWGGNGYFLMVLADPRDIVVDHNTIIQERASGIVLAEGPPILGFTFTNNLVRHNDYGLFGSDHSPGNDTIRAFFPASTIVSNVIADGQARLYPAGNLFPSSAEFRRQFVAYDSADYRLVTGSAWRGAGTDGLDLGATGTTNVLPPRPRAPIIREQ